MKKNFAIDGHPVESGRSPFVIAEAGINHNGELEKALEMVRVAKTAGADAIKFQTFKAEEFVGDSTQTYTYQSQGKQVTESMLAMFQRCELTRASWFAIKNECKRQGISFLSTPQNRGDLALLMELGITAIKVGSDDFTNLPLLQDYACTGLPMILSCGMADMAEVHQALEAVGAYNGYPVVLLVCTSQYPTPAEHVNLQKIRTLAQAFPMIGIGFSDHTQGPLASSLATALGAVLVEKHFTLSHDLPGPDHWFSENPDGLVAWVSAIRKSYAMMGSPVISPTPAEREMRQLARRSIVAISDIKCGEIFSMENIDIRRPGTGLSPSLLGEVIGKAAAISVKNGEPIVSSFISNYQM